VQLLAEHKAEVLEALAAKAVPADQSHAEPPRSRFATAPFRHHHITTNRHTVTILAAQGHPRFFRCSRMFS
jgi:hypothetical protein